MSPKQVKRWARTRQMGRTRYVWLIGVLGFGLTLGVCLPVAIAAVGSWLPGKIVPGWERLPVHLVGCLIVCPIGGYFFGVCMWRAVESEYERATQFHPTERVLDRAEELLERWEKAPHGSQVAIPQTPDPRLHPPGHLELGDRPAGRNPPDA
jgi:hypothetical protein